VTIVVVTHDPVVSGQVPRTLAIRDGRTSAEIRRTARITADGGIELVTAEYAVLYRTGRMRLPSSYVHELEKRDRVEGGAYGTAAR
jgi:putative ABC transport system ATP-binding protein